MFRAVSCVNRAGRLLAIPESVGVRAVFEGPAHSSEMGAEMHPGATAPPEAGQRA